MVWLQVPQRLALPLFSNTWPNDTSFKPFFSIWCVMTVWAADSLPCQSKGAQLWQKLVLNLAGWWVCCEKLKYVQIIRVHWEEGGRALRCFMVVCLFFHLFFLFSETQMDWTMHFVRRAPDTLKYSVWCLIPTSRAANQRDLFYENPKHYFKRCLCS